MLRPDSSSIASRQIKRFPWPTGRGKRSGANLALFENSVVMRASASRFVGPSVFLYPRLQKEDWNEQDSLPGRRSGHC